MDDKQLDELLDGLKNNYERFPAYSDARKIMNELPEKRKKRKRFIVIPLVAVLSSFLLFFILALPTAENYQNAAYSKDRLTEYAEEKKEEFHAELGLDSIDDFILQEDIQNFIDTHPDSLEKEEFEEAKTVIDYFFTTPRSAMEELNNNNAEEDRAEQWLSLNSTMETFRQQLENYFQQLKIEHSLGKEQQEALYDNLDNYSGPIEIIEFLKLVEEQGYFIVKGHTMHDPSQEPEGLTVRINYNTVLSQVEVIEQDEGIREFLTFVTEKMDIHQGGHNNKFNVPWHEYDDVLLEFEEIYRSYPEDRELIRMYGGTAGAVGVYLNDYLYAGMANHTVPVEEYDEAVFENEIESFVENHPNSIFWPLIAATLEDYENGDWPIYNNFYGYQIQFMLNTVEDEVDYQGLYDMHEWPIISSTGIYYSNYEKRQNINTIKELVPFEFLSMYIYAASKDDPLYDDLYAGQSERENVNWQELVKESSILVENNLSKEIIEFTFVSMEHDVMTNDYLATVTIQYDDGWEVIEQEILQ